MAQTLSRGNFTPGRLHPHTVTMALTVSCYFTPSPSATLCPSLSTILFLHLIQMCLSPTILKSPFCSHLTSPRPFIPSCVGRDKYSINYYYYYYYYFSGLHPWHMEVPRLGAESELQLPAYTATGTRDKPLLQSTPQLTAKLDP